ncbi:hypothetical protein KR222_002878 [Zaprionus bogoriensis]|nr:hypothetical protein KR222_002878 [Zaprionus bogoriensis]
MNNFKTETVDCDAEAQILPQQFNWQLTRSNALEGRGGIKTERDAGDAWHSSQPVSDWQQAKEPQHYNGFDSDVNDAALARRYEPIRQASKRNNSSEMISSKRRKHMTNDTKLPEIFRFFNNVEKVRDCNAKPGAIAATCNACQSRIKGFITVTSNFIKHLRLKHCEMHAAFMSGKQVANAEAPDTESDSDAFENRIMDYIIDSSLPVSTVETSSFRNLFRGTNLQVLSQAKLERQLDERYTKMCANLKQLIGANKYVCMTADIWSSRECSFLGYTCHWLNQNYQRKSVALACKRFSGDQRQAKEIIGDIHSEFELNNLKIVATITRNGSNFCREFKEFGIVTEIENDNSEEFTISMEDFKQVLPNHMLCASYSFNKLVSADFMELLGKNIALKQRHEQIFEKCAQLWCKCSCPKTAETITAVLCEAPVIPSISSWYSIYDAISYLLRHKQQLAELCGKLSLHNACFAASDIAYLEEYSTVMAPIAQTIAFLQNDNNLSYGCLIPALISLCVKLKRVSDACELNDLKEVAIGLQAKLKLRFSEYFQLTAVANSAIIATVLCPNIKMRWFNVLDKVSAHNRSADDIHGIVIDAVVRHLKALEDLEKPTLARTACSNKREDFYEFEAFDNACDLDRSPSSSSKLTEEVTSQFHGYLQDPGTSFELLERYPLLLDLSIKHNTPLTSSAPVERLLSFMNIIRFSRRSDPTNYPFEKLVLLKANSSI